MEQTVKQAIAFFKSEKVYEKLFNAFRKKYESLGRIGGNVSIKSFSDRELEVVGQFFGFPGEELKQKGIVSLTAFEQQLQHTKFDKVSLKQLLDAYFGEVIISRKEQKAEKATKLRLFLQEQQHCYPRLAFWIHSLMEQKREVRRIIQFVEKNRERFISCLDTLHRAMKFLPEEAERLPMFSQRITGDPHTFDLHTELGRMFIHLLTVHRARLSGASTYDIPSTTEEVNELLQSYHIYRDDLLNFVTCANLFAETANGIHPVWKVAVKENTVQIVPLRELIHLKKIYPAGHRVIWVVENSGVCATLLDHKPDIPIVCTNGQFTLASFMLMDVLVKSGCVLAYSGDFDPEGLGMTQRLIDRYGDAVRLWHMDQRAYQKSQPTKLLSKERLEKLNGITDERLRKVAESMQSMRRAGYQEAIVDWMITDIEGEVENKQ